LTNCNKNTPFVGQAWTVQGVMFHKNSSKGSRETPKILPSSHKMLLIIHLPQPNLPFCSACVESIGTKFLENPFNGSQVTSEEVLSSQCKALLIID
jgi:hypothetical protein